MGMFDREPNDDDPANQLLNKQIADAEIDRQNKRNSLYETELSIVKSQGAPNWNAPPPAMKKDPKNPFLL